MLAWLAPQGHNALQRCESAKEALNRACQLLSVHGSWPWLPKMACVLARTVVGLQSEVARLEGITYRSWDFHQPSRAVLDSIADLSHETAVCGSPNCMQPLYFLMISLRNWQPVGSMQFGARSVMQLMAHVIYMTLWGCTSPEFRHCLGLRPFLQYSVSRYHTNCGIRELFVSQFDFSAGPLGKNVMPEFQDHSHYIVAWYHRCAVSVHCMWILNFCYMSSSGIQLLTAVCRLSTHRHVCLGLSALLAHLCVGRHSLIVAISILFIALAHVF